MVEIKIFFKHESADLADKYTLLFVDMYDKSFMTNSYNIFEVIKKHSLGLFCFRFYPSNN